MSVTYKQKSDLNTAIENIQVEKHLYNKTVWQQILMTDILSKQACV